MSFRRLQLDPATAAALTRLAPGETITFLGRCPEPRCRHGVRLELPGITIFGPDSPHRGFGFDPESPYGHEPPRGFVCPPGSSWIGTGAYLTSFAQKDHACPDHWRGFVFKELHAILVSTVACSATCEEATGAECKCSCGGANHGAAA